MNRIEISTAEVVAYQDENVLWTSPSSTIAHSLFGMAAAPAELLPPAVRWIGPGGLVWVWEQPPLLYRCTLERGENRIIRLPWHVYIVHMENGPRCGEIQVFARNSPLTSMDDALCMLPFPGMPLNGTIPMRFTPRRHAAEQTLTGAAMTLTNCVWHGELGDGHRPEKFRGLEPFDYLKVWQDLDLLTLTSLDWQPVCTLNDIAQECVLPQQQTVIEMFTKAAGHVPAG